jgi:hypothetical protein
MDITHATELLLSELDLLSGDRLMRREDLGVLLELGRLPGRRAVLDDLAFSAKFLARARRMMERVGPGGEGYDRLAGEFARHLEKAAVLLHALLEGAPAGVRGTFLSRYTAQTPQGLAEFLALASDLAWYKNRLIDRGAGDAPPAS